MNISGDKIREVRLAKGLTLTQLSQKASVTWQAAQQWEKVGIKSFRLLKKVAIALNIDPMELVE